ncbi:ABC transporter ATP-binding protein [Bacillus velezensis]|uniref:ABC transporter ATP-binding protein n=1 Tax=Bacillus TaxID=1386 RepID=UPI000C85ECAB|nr:MULTISPECIES: ABC transporter ATP-binding protein [Bacillus amyloliquefaciens group]MED4524861.1 ABC transporter ATP-binding protein [Bacillus velezensis]QGJ63420.1 ABC transporter ATP-binding protein [Bacillus velezensis]
MKQVYKLLKVIELPKYVLMICLLLSLLETAFSLSIPLLTRELVDSFSKGLDFTKIIVLTLVLLFQTFLSGILLYLLNRIGQKVVKSIRVKGIKKIFTFNMGFFEKNKSGDIISKITNDTLIIKDFFGSDLISFISGIIAVIGSIIILIVLDWRLTLVLIVSIPLISLFLLPMGGKVLSISQRQQHYVGSLTSFLNRVLDNIKLIKISNTESHEEKKGIENATHIYRESIKEAKIFSILTPLISLVLMLIIVSIIMYGGYRVSSHTLTSGDLMAFIMYLIQIIIPVSSIGEFFVTYKKSLGAINRVNDLIFNKEVEKKEGLKYSEPNTNILFKNVSFSYNEEKETLKDISFSLKPGTVTALVGPSGAGKTTIFSLLERLYEPKNGGIFLNNKLISEYELQEWRKQIGYVTQETPIIDGTILDNILYGTKGDFTKEQIDSVLERTYLKKDVGGFSKGIHTEVGEKGMKLSAGQRQRIAIARVILRDPKLLLLDEATSNLDSHSEEIIKKTLDYLMGEKTSLVIAHRLSTILTADNIIILENGRVSGSGTHKDLYEMHPLYKRLVDLQFDLSEVK